MNRLVFALIIFCCASLYCSAQNSNSIKPISQESFLEEPFGFEENIENFNSKTKTKFKTQRYFNRNKHYPEKTDTIYKFHYRKSEIFYIKTHLGQEFLLAGKIMNRKIQLVNNIHVGIKKDEFISRFSDKLIFENDSLEMIGEGTKYTFIFKKNKLYRINIDNYFD